MNEQFVVYHSNYWARLVETGWVTMYVEHGVACMLWVGRR